MTVGRQTIDMLEATPAFSTPEKFPNQRRQALRLLEVRNMPAPSNIAICACAMRFANSPV